MEHEERNSNPFKIIVFIVLGGALVILTDLFILDKNQTLLNNFASGPSAESVEYSNLQIRHKLYMNDGIDIDPEIIVATNFARPPKINEYVEIIDTSAKNTVEYHSVDIDLANISPAMGIERRDEDLVRYFEKKPLVETAKFVENKNVTDVIRDLHVNDTKSHIVDDAVVSDLSSGLMIKGDNVAESDVVKEYSTPKGGGRVVIIIDDMGISLRSKLVEVLPGPLTLSYLPYAKNLPERVKRASDNGHELMLHMPMEPINGNIDGGPHVLKTSQNNDDFIKTLEWGLSSFDGFVGLNNHMGSNLTQDDKSMRRVMNHIKDTGLFFIDSKTIGSSVVERVAKEIGIPYAVRDVFLDHEINAEFISSALKKLENTAHKQGYAIAIGHPHKETIAALKNWLPTLKSKGLTLVPASMVIKHPIDSNGDIAFVD